MKIVRLDEGIMKMKNV